MSTLDPAGEGARRIASLTWFLVVFSGIVYLIVMAALAWAVARNRRRNARSVDLTRHGTKAVVIGGAVLPALIFAVVFVVSLRAMGAFPVRADRSPHFQVTGHQWWWDVEYLDPVLPGRFHTANELHVPVGQVVRVTLVSADVIHSFWVPRLQGKVDLTPGDTTEIRILAERPGTYRGQCAEYCGMQHAHMAFTVVAEDSASYLAWIAAQQAAVSMSAGDSLASGATAADSLVILGRRLVASGPCSLCHTIRGTEARGQVAPDLTHVGSRRTIAAGALPNTPGNLEAWVANAPSLKPGTRMPAITQFSGRELRAITAYLQSLR
jgi:cytochrome c oxidase subunit 2